MLLESSVLKVEALIVEFLKLTSTGCWLCAMLEFKLRFILLLVSVRSVNTRLLNMILTFSDRIKILVASLSTPLSAKICRSPFEILYFALIEFKL